MSRRRPAGAWWRGRRRARLDAPPKDHVHASVEEQLVQRLRAMRLPELPPSLRERDRQSYRDWLASQSGRHRWRD